MVEAEETDAVAEALVEAEVKLMTDGRTVDVGTWVPVWPKQVGGDKDTLNNKSEDNVVGAGYDYKIGGVEGEGRTW